MINTVNPRKMHVGSLTKFFLALLHDFYISRPFNASKGFASKYKETGVYVLVRVLLTLSISAYDLIFLMRDV